MGESMIDDYKEAEYHFTLSAMLDLIEQYGYCNVMNDLDDMIAEKVNKKLEALV
jgi:hypothetical protein